MKKVCLIVLLHLYYAEICAQSNDIHGNIAIQGILTTKDETPFWFRADQFGSIPLSGASGSVVGAIRKDYDSTRKRLVDWGSSLEVRLNTGQETKIILIEGYVKARLSIFELKAGRAREIMGLVDTTLSSGGFAVSGNALGIPKVQLAIPDYYTLPFFGRLFSVKGNFAYGWLGKVPIQTGDRVNQAETYFNQASLYGQFGRPDWKFKLDAGFNHQVFWGSERSIFGDSFKISSLRAAEYATIGKTYEGSKVGNHLGSIDLGAEYVFENVRLMLYRQNFFDEGALFHLANLRDGLNGLSIVNIGADRKGFNWKRMVVEVFYSKDQAGYPWSKSTPSGDENYYNNYEYAQGWSYKGLGLGSPFITTRNSTVKGLPDQPTDYFNNNRVIAAYLGMQGSWDSWDLTARFSYSWNYGTFGTSPWGYSTGRNRVAPRYGLFPEKKEFSGYLKVRKTFNHGLALGLLAALDNGGLLYNSTGAVLELSKSF
jgi:hypothetical protein